MGIYVCTYIYIYVHVHMYEYNDILTYIYNVYIYIYVVSMCTMGTSLDKGRYGNPSEPRA